MALICPYRIKRVKGTHLPPYKNDLEFEDQFAECLYGNCPCYSNETKRIGDNITVTFICNKDGRDLWLGSTIYEYHEKELK